MKPAKKYEKYYGYFMQRSIFFVLFAALILANPLPAMAKGYTYAKYKQDQKKYEKCLIERRALEAESELAHYYASRDVHDYPVVERDGILKKREYARAQLSEDLDENGKPTLSAKIVTKFNECGDLNQKMTEARSGENCPECDYYKMLYAKETKTGEKNYEKKFGTWSEQEESFTKKSEEYSRSKKDKEKSDSTSVK